MNAAVLHTLGKPPRFEQFPEPIPAEGQVLVHVRAASLKPVDKQIAAGTHYTTFRELPAVCGLDGVGVLDDGSRVFFAGPRLPYGAMAERTVVRRAQCFTVPEGLSDEVAAALPNPGVSAWLTLKERAKLVPGEAVLILGATGVTGKLAVQTAKILGAGRVIAAGRNEKALNSLLDLGADVTIQIDRSGEELTKVFAREAGDKGFHVVIDYLWGRPTEALLAAIMRNEFAVAGSETRLVQVGESAGASISLPAAVLRSTPLTILGTAGIPAPEILMDAFQQVLAYGASGKLRIDTERVPLADIESAWQKDQRSRLVIIPS
jgi:NADPH:quinone reductase-like Zn-dependent oxidoreductase